MISIAEVAKETWDILCVAFEETDAVCESRLELLTAKFTNLQMIEEETINDFNGRLCDIASESFAIGEIISKEKLIQKDL